MLQGLHCPHGPSLACLQYVHASPGAGGPRPSSPDVSHYWKCFFPNRVTKRENHPSHPKMLLRCEPRTSRSKNFLSFSHKECLKAPFGAVFVHAGYCHRSAVSQINKSVILFSLVLLQLYQDLLNSHYSSQKSYEHVHLHPLDSVWLCRRFLAGDSFNSCVSHLCGNERGLMSFYSLWSRIS